MSGVSITTLADRIEHVRSAVREAAYRTPLELSAWLSHVTGAGVSFKLECYQPTGSFKIRGAVAAITQLAAGERAKGVVTASAGNHGLGIAYAATRVGVPAIVVIPDDASTAKVAALRRFPIDLRTGGSGYDSAERQARALSQSSGVPFVSAYNDVWVMAGQGTIGPELLEDMPDLDVVLVPVGGGGLISGIGSWLKVARPDVRVIGVESEASAAMNVALRAGAIVHIPISASLADGLAGNIEPGSLSFDVARQVIDEIVLVTEDEIACAIRETYAELHLALEGSAVVGIAALLANRIRGIDGQRIAVVVTGRNIAADRLCAVVSASHSASRGGLTR